MILHTERGSKIEIGDDNGAISVDGRKLGVAQTQFCPHDLADSGDIDPASLSDEPSKGSILIVFSGGNIAFTSDKIIDIEK